MNITVLTKKFINCISEISNRLIDNAEDTDVVMPMQNLFEYMKNYKKQQVVCGIIVKMNQEILFFLIRNLVNTRQASQEKLIMLLMVMMVMM